MVWSAEVKKRENYTDGKEKQASEMIETKCSSVIIILTEKQ